MMVIDCNTATAYALKDIRNYVARRRQIPIVGVIDAGVKAALEYQRSHNKGTIGIFSVWQCLQFLVMKGLQIYGFDKATKRIDHKY